MKAMLTKMGIIIPINDGKQWALFTNEGYFLQEMSLSKVNNLLYNKEFIEVNVKEEDFPITSEKLPTWKFLWSVSNVDNSNYIGSMSCNGGAYSNVSTHYYYLAEMPNGQWKFRVFTRNQSSAEFHQDDDGHYCQVSECTDYICANTEEKLTVRYQDGGDKEDDTLMFEDVSFETSFDLAVSAVGSEITSPFTYDGIKEYESELIVEDLVYSTLKERIIILQNMGFENPKRVKSRRNRNDRTRR